MVTGGGGGGWPAEDSPVSEVLRTDLYELRMAASYLRRRMHGSATFSLFVRRVPPGRRFLVAAGVASCLEFLERYRLSGEDLEELARLGFDRPTLDDLATVRFSGDVMAVPEGRIVLAGEPLLEVTAPIAEAQLVETALLQLTTFPTAVASKAARCRLAAGDAMELVEFGLRRAQGAEAGTAAAWGAGIVGFAGTSNVEAALRFGMRAVGTMAHSYVEAFPDELSAFRAFAEDHPSQSTFLVDTYDTEQGIARAIEVIRALDLPHAAVRLDSGHLGELARTARRLLDEAGLASVRIFVSGNLDEHRLSELVASGAPVDGAGVGTQLAVSADAPYLETVYKLVAYEGRPVRKLSEGKASLPGAKQVWRRRGLADVVCLRHEEPPADAEALLEPVMAGGRRLLPTLSADKTLTEANRRFDEDLGRLPPAARALEGAPLEAALSPELVRLAEALRASRR